MRGAVRRAARPIRPLADRWGTRLLAPPRAHGGTVLHGDRSVRRIALTFDDGPSSPSTDWTLDALDEVGVSATFFVLGLSVEWYPDTARSIVERGHEIGLHSYDHARRHAVSPRDSGHLDRTIETVERVVGVRPTAYRPPWGWLTPWEAERLRRRDLTPIGWDVYPDDWKIPETPGEVIAEQVVERVQPGSIVLLHDATSLVRECSKTETVAAVRRLVPRLHADGYEFATVSTLLGLTPYRAPTSDTAAASATRSDEP